MRGMPPLGLDRKRPNSRGALLFLSCGPEEKYGDALFVHQQYVAKRQIDCFFCHLIVEHGNVRMAKEPERAFRLTLN